MIQAVPQNGRGLLVLSCYEEEGIRIGSDVYVKITRVEGGRVSVGIAAPKDVRCYRDKVIPTLTREDHLRDHRTHLERLSRLASEVGYELVPIQRPAVKRAA